MSSFNKTEADLRLEGLSIWADGFTHPDSEDYWDGNWLNATVVYEAPGSRVESSTLLHLSDLERLLVEIRAIQSANEGEISFEPMEPELEIHFKLNKMGHLDMVVFITPDHMLQEHKYSFTIDQTYLALLTSQLETLLKKFPTRFKDKA